MRLPMIIACPVLFAFTAAVGFSQSVPDSIVAEGVPEVPGTLAESLVALSEHPHGHLPGVVRRSPRGPDHDPVRRHQPGPPRRLPGGARTQLTFSRDRVLGASSRPGARSVRLRSRPRRGRELSALPRRPRRRDRSRGSPTAARGTCSARWSNSGSRLAWSSNARNGRDMDLFVVDPASPRSARRLKDVDGDWIGRRLVARRQDGRGRRVSLDQRDLRPPRRRRDRARPKRSPRAAPARRRPSRTPTSAGRRTARRSTGRPTSTPSSAASPGTISATRTSTTLTAGIPWDVDGFDLSDDGTTIVLFANEDGISRTPRPRRRERPGAARTGAPGRAGRGNWSFAGDSLEFGFSLTSARSPTDVYSYDLDGGKIARWTSSETGGLNPNTFAEPELIRYPSFDGLSIPAFVYRPSSTAVPRPAPGPDRHPRRPRGAVSPRLPRPDQLPDRRVGDRAGLPQRPGLVGLRQVVPEARQRSDPRGFRQGHRRPARLDRQAARPGRVAGGGDRGLLRRLHVAGDPDPLQRSAQGGDRHRRHLELRHVPGEHARLSPRPPSGRVWRRARPGDEGDLRDDLTPDERGEDQGPAAGRPREERPARARRRNRSRSSRGCVGGASPCGRSSPRTRGTASPRRRIRTISRRSRSSS